MSRLSTVIYYTERQIARQEGTHVPQHLYWLIIRHTAYAQQICGVFSHQSLGRWLPKFLEEV